MLFVYMGSKGNNSERIAVGWVQWLAGKEFLAYIGALG